MDRMTEVRSGWGDSSSTTSEWTSCSDLSSISEAATIVMSSSEEEQHSSASSSSGLLDRVSALATESLTNRLLDSIVETLNKEEVVPITESKPALDLGTITSDLAKTKDPGIREIVDIIVSEVFTPSNFFFQLIRDQDLLERMLTAINSFYAGAEFDGTLTELPDRDFKIGSLVATKWADDGYWYRARISSIESRNRVQVMFLEYGTKYTASRKELFTLESKFKSWGFMAYRAKLSGIRSFTGRWTKAAAERFQQLIGGGVVKRDMGIKATIIKVDANTCKSEVRLVDKHGEDIIEVMLRENHARLEAEPRQPLSRAGQDHSATLTPLWELIDDNIQLVERLRLTREECPDYTPGKRRRMAFDKTEDYYNGMKEVEPLNESGIMPDEEYYKVVRGYLNLIFIFNTEELVIRTRPGILEEVMTTRGRNGDLGQNDDLGGWGTIEFWEERVRELEDKLSKRNYIDP